MTETRKDRRASVSLKVRFKSATVDEFIEQYAQDISRGGIFIKSKNPMAVGTLLKFEFQLKDESRLIRGVGRVVWRRDTGDADGDKPPGMGIKFIKMDPESRAIVDRIVASRGDKGDVDHIVSERDGGGEPVAEEIPKAMGSEALAPEDRTVIRHASEFLATALADADSTAAAEAEANAEKARRRGEELAMQQQKAKPASAVSRPSMPAAGGRTSSVPPLVRSSVPATSNGALDAGLPMVGNHSYTDSEQTAVANLNEPTAVARPTLPPEEKRTSSIPPVAKGPRVQSELGDDLGAPKQFGAKPPAETGGSKALPVVLGLAALAAVGFVVFRPKEAPPETEVSQPVDSTETSATNDVAPVEPTQPENAAGTTPEVAENAGASEETPTVKVNVQSTPPGASISVNGQPQGVTPSQISLPVGKEAEVIVSAVGFAPSSQKVTATDTMTQLDAVVLQALPYVLEVETNPPGARVVANGQSITTPGTFTFRNAPRTTNLVVTKRGYLQLKEAVESTSFVPAPDAMRHKLSLVLQAVEAPAPSARRRAPAVTAPAAQGEAAAPAPTETPATEAAPSPPPQPQAAPHEEPPARPAPPPERAAPEAPLPENPF